MNSLAAASERRRRLSPRANSLALILNFYSSTALGYVGWLVAARLFTPASVGLASGAISAAVLCATVGLLGLGSAVITFLPREEESSEDLLNGFLTLVLTTAAVVAAAFLLIAYLGLSKLRVIATNPVYAGSFLLLVTSLCILGFLESVAIVLRRADYVVVRNVAASLLKIVCFFPVAVLVARTSSTPIVAVWAGATAAACFIAYGQTQRSITGYRYRPRITARPLELAIRSGLSNHILTLALYAPQLLFPLIVTERISPTAAAHWYGLWMLALLTRIIPNSFAQSVFAELTTHGARAAGAFRSGLKLAIIVGALGAAIAALTAPWLLELLGHGYSMEGTTPLRIILPSVIFQAFTEFYVVSCRAERRLVPPLVALAVTGLLSVVAAVLVAPSFGLPGVAAAWLGMEVVMGTWALTKLSSKIPAFAHGKREIT
jgi:O-antigen/teichoic acid export membrane protein